MKTVTVKRICLLLFFIIVCVSLYISINIIMESLVHDKTKVKIPNFVGKNLYSALEKTKLYKIGLTYSSYEFSDIYPFGIILRQDPIAGIIVNEGKIVKVVISNGNETVYVPNLIGHSIRSAEIILKRFSLIIGNISRRYSNNFDKDVVIYQDVNPETVVNKNTIINIVVSDGFYNV
jgi:serine/threonine-protein kinase